MGITALAVSCVAVLLWSGVSGSAFAQGLGRRVEIRAPLWMAGDGFTSSLTINNTRPRPVAAELGVYDHDGRRIPTQALKLGPLASVDVDLGAMLGGRTGFGRIALGHDGGLLDVAAQVVMRHRQRGLTFNQGLLPAGHQDGADLAGVSDLGASAAGSLLALANVGGKKRRVSIELLLDNRRFTGSVELGAGQTRLVSLGDVSQNRQPVSETALGVRVRHDGVRGEVQAQGLLMTAGGLAANLRLADRAALRSRRALSPLLRYDARQRPLLALYNLSPVQVSVIPEIRFLVGETHGLIQAAAVRLLPGSVQGVDLTDELRPYPEARDLSLSLRHEGTAGSVAAELLIVDAAGRSAAQATPKDTAGEGTVGMTFAWRLDKKARTVIAVANPSASEAIDFEAVLFFGGRTYSWAGEGFLRPGEARHIDIRRLRDEQVPDQSGELLPLDVTSGQAKVFVRNTPKRVDKLIGQALQVEADGSLAGFLSCPVCPPDDSSVSLSPLSLSGDVGGSKPIKAWLHGTDGSKSLVINPLAVAWDVGNEKVATVSGSNFQVKFQGPGKTTIGATINGCTYALPEQDPADDAAPVECTCAAVALTAAKKATATTNAPTLSCPSSVTRGKSLTARVSNLGTAKIKWEFLDGGSATVTKSGHASWSGVMVTSGTIRATITPLKGDKVVKECAVSVNNRSGWKVSAVAAKKKTNGRHTCGEETVLRVPSPPRKDQKIGAACLEQARDYTTTTVSDGPNKSYKYVTSITNDTEYSWVISPDLEDMESTFYRAQCGNYNPQTGAGFISGANLKANTIRHESGSSQSHYANYKTAQDKLGNNIGTVGEQLVGNPSLTKKKFEEMIVEEELKKRERAILVAMAIEPFSVLHSASGVFQGKVNYSPYEACEE